MSSLFCRIELSKTDGIIVTLDNKDGQVIHTVVLNGDSITTQSQSTAETSVIVQTPDKIAINCKTFEIKADQIDCQSTGKTTLQAGSDFAISTKTNFRAAATNEANIEATRVAISGSAEIKATAGIINLQ
jgi:hypothetical protein